MNIEALGNVRKAREVSRFLRRSAALSQTPHLQPIAADLSFWAGASWTQLKRRGPSRTAIQPFLFL